MKRLHFSLSRLLRPRLCLSQSFLSSAQMKRVTDSGVASAMVSCHLSSGFLRGLPGGRIRLDHRRCCRESFEGKHTHAHTCLKRMCCHAAAADRRMFAGVPEMWQSKQHPVIESPPPGATMHAAPALSAIVATSPSLPLQGRLLLLPPFRSNLPSSGGCARPAPRRPPHSSQISCSTKTSFPSAALFPVINLVGNSQTVTILIPLPR